MRGSPELEAVLRREIEKIRGVNVLFPQRESAFGPMVADVMFRDDQENMHFLEVVGGTPTLRNLAVLTLLRDYHKKRTWGEGKPGFYLAAKSVPSVVKQVAKDIDVDVILIPENVHVPSRGAVLPSRLGVTSLKAWKVMFHLLLEPADSINALSRKTGVSYGWTHLLVTGLIEQGVLEGRGGHIELVSQERLLDLVAWERPMAKREIKYVRTDQSDARFLADALTVDLEGPGGDFAFTGPTAASWRTGAHKSEGRLDVYMPDPTRLDDLVSVGDGVGVHAYVPDRSLSVNHVEKTPVVDDTQLVLDLAGFGPRYHDHLSAVLARARLKR